MSAPAPPPSAAATALGAPASIVGRRGAGAGGRAGRRPGSPAWARLGVLDDDGGGGDRRRATAAAERARPRRRRTRPSWRGSTSRSSTGATAGANECTRLEVPLDYADPDGKTHRARGAARAGDAARAARRAAGGQPGWARGLGRRLRRFRCVHASATQLTRYFDIVGFDPRGVGKSTPLECGDTEQTDEFLDADPDPDTPAEASGLDRLTREFGEGCLRAQRRPGPAHLHRRGGEGHGHPAGRAGRAAAGLPRCVVRHPARRHVRRPLPHARPPDGPRRSDRPDAVERAAQPRPGPRVRDRADGLPGVLHQARATASSATPSRRGPRRIRQLLDELDARAAADLERTASSPRGSRGSASSCRSTSRTTGRCSPSR